jgi:hypothetical protein
MQQLASVDGFDAAIGSFIPNRDKTRRKEKQGTN